MTEASIYPPDDVCAQLRARGVGLCKPHLFRWDGCWWKRYVRRTGGTYGLHFVAIDLAPECTVKL